LSKLENVEAGRLLELKEMFNRSGAAVVSLYEPTAEDVMALKELLGVDNSASDSADDLKSNDGDNDDQLRVYSIGKDNRGSILTYEGVRMKCTRKIRQKEGVEREVADGK